LGSQNDCITCHLGSSTYFSVITFYSFVFSVKDTLVANCYTNVASHVQHQHHQQQLQDHQQDHQAQQSSNNCSSLPFATRSLSAGPMKAP
jgi:hypothetical protein